MRSAMMGRGTRGLAMGWWERLDELEAEKRGGRIRPAWVDRRRGPFGDVVDRGADALLPLARSAYEAL